MYKIAAVLFLAILAGCSASGTTESNPSMKVGFLPVGGYAALFSFPKGGTMLVDTGDAACADELIKSVRSQMLGDQFVYRFLLFFGWQPRIDWLVISDVSPDRTGALGKILENFRVWKIYLPYDLNNLRTIQSKEIKNLMLLLGMVNRPMFPLSHDNGINLYQDKAGVKLSVLNPEKPQNFDSKPELCIRIDHNRRRFLLSSALCEETQEEFCNYKREEIKADVSYIDSDTDAKFLRIVAPLWEIKRGQSASFITDGIDLKIKEEGI